MLDTSVVVSALRSRLGASNAVLRLVSEGRVTPLATIALFLEYEDVIKRPEQRLAHGLDDGQLDAFLRALAAASEGVDVHFRWRPQLTDPGDEMVLEAAVNGQAQALVTHNVRDFEVAACTSDQESLLRSARQAPVDVALIAAEWGDGRLAGLTMAQRMREANPDCAIVLLLEETSPQLIVEAMRSGAS